MNWAANSLAGSANLPNNIVANNRRECMPYIIGNNIAAQKNDNDCVHIKIFDGEVFFLHCSSFVEDKLDLLIWDLGVTLQSNSNR